MRPSRRRRVVDRDELGYRMYPNKITTALVSATCILSLAGSVAAEESEIEWLKQKVEELQRRVRRDLS